MASTTCTCGQLLNDSSDFTEYRVRFVSDMDDYDYPGPAQGGGDRKLSLEREAYQCHECGRIWIETRSGAFAGFLPEQEKWIGIFSSVKNDTWKRRLEARWYEIDPITDPHPQVEERGYISYVERSRTFVTWQELERAYYEIFEQLRSGDQLRSASLRKGDAFLHSWPDDRSDSE